MLEHKADPNKITGGYNSLQFHLENQRINSNIIRLLLNNKASTNVCPNSNRSLLHIACSNDSVRFDTIKLLLDSNVSPIILDYNLQLAIEVNSRQFSDFGVFFTLLTHTLDYTLPFNGQVFVNQFSNFFFIFK